MSHHIIGLAETVRSLTSGAVSSVAANFSNVHEGMANSTDHKISQPSMLPLIEDVPATLLESFLPGFSVVRRFALLTFGFDSTYHFLVALSFLISISFGYFS